MEAIKKLYDARLKIKSTPIEKAGWNDYSKYKYFTPDQISEITSNPEFGLLNKFDLVRTELGLMARLSVIDIETGKSVNFEIATDIPAIKATNVAQQLGGCVTYSERYLLQIAYDIKDNNLDFDTDQKKPQEKKKPILNPNSDKWPKAIQHLKDGKPVKEITDNYEITEEHVQTLILASEL